MHAVQAFDLPADILNSISIACLKVSHSAGASHPKPSTLLAGVRIATATLAFRPHDFASFFNCAKLAQGLDWVQHARDCVDSGLLLDETNVELLQLKQELNGARREF